MDSPSLRAIGRRAFRAESFDVRGKRVVNKQFVTRGSALEADNVVVWMTRGRMG